MTMLVKNLTIKDSVKWVECVENWYDKNDNPSGSITYKKVQDFYKEFGERFVYSVCYANDFVSVIFGNKAKEFVGEI